MGFINVSASYNGSYVKTKKALRELLKSDPAGVHFEQVAPLFQGYTVWTGVDYPAADTLSICGPDPYRMRKWYASYRDGKLS